MRAGGVTGRADIADEIALIDIVTGRNGIMRHVAIERREAVAVVDRDIVAVAGREGCGRHRAALRGIDGRTLRNGKVNAVMEAIAAVDRMIAIAIRGCNHNTAARRKREEEAASVCAATAAAVVAAVVATVIAAAITSQIGKARLPTHIELTAQSVGLNRDSVILLEQIRTIDKSRLRERMGRLDEGTMTAVDNALAVSFGLGT